MAEGWCVMPYYSPDQPLPGRRSADEAPYCAPDESDLRSAARQRLRHADAADVLDYVTEAISDRGYKHKLNANALAWVRLVQEAIVTGNDAQLGQMIRTAVHEYALDCERVARL